MATYEVGYTCGHQGKLQIFGSQIINPRYIHEPCQLCRSVAHKQVALHGLSNIKRKALRETSTVEILKMAAISRLYEYSAVFIREVSGMRFEGKMAQAARTVIMKTMLQAVEGVKNIEEKEWWIRNAETVKTHVHDIAKRLRGEELDKLGMEAAQRAEIEFKLQEITRKKILHGKAGNA